MVVVASVVVPVETNIPVLVVIALMKFEKKFVLVAEVIVAFVANRDVDVSAVAEAVESVD